MKTFLKLWCEWDFGQDGFIFDDEATGKAWLKETILNSGNTLDELGFISVEQIFDEGLAGFDIVQLVA